MQLSGKTLLYGGSFDPPHISHQMTCLYLLEALDAQAVWIIPSFCHPFGKHMGPYSERFAMCAEMARCFGERVLVSDVEKRLGGAGRTFDTVAHLQQQHPDKDFALAVGADCFEQRRKWYRWEELEKMLPIVVVGRYGYPRYQSAVALPAISSTEIRQSLHQGRSITGLVPMRVARHIETSNLYSNEES